MLREIADRANQEQVQVLGALARAVSYAEAAVAEPRPAKRSSGVSPRPAVSAPPSGLEPRHVSSVIPDELVPFFECVQNHESASAGRYAAVQQPSGKYRGAYQMDRSFWRSHAPAEWKYLADSGNWETAPPEVQDQTALTGYRNQGPGAWSGPGGPICRQYIR